MVIASFSLSIVFRSPLIVFSSSRETETGVIRLPPFLSPTDMSKSDCRMLIGLPTPLLLPLNFPQDFLPFASPCTFLLFSYITVLFFFSAFFLSPSFHSPFSPFYRTRGRLAAKAIARQAFLLPFLLLLLIFSKSHACFLWISSPRPPRFTPVLKAECDIETGVPVITLLPFWSPRREQRTHNSSLFYPPLHPSFNFPVLPTTRRWLPFLPFRPLSRPLLTERSTLTRPFFFAKPECQDDFSVHVARNHLP